MFPQEFFQGENYFDSAGGTNTQKKQQNDIQKPEKNPLRHTFWKSGYQKPLVHHPLPKNANMFTT